MNKLLSNPNKKYKNPTHTKLKVNAVLLVCPSFQLENNPTK